VGRRCRLRLAFVPLLHLQLLSSKKAKKRVKKIQKANKGRWVCWGARAEKKKDVASVVIRRDRDRAQEELRVPPGEGIWVAFRRNKTDNKRVGCAF
jgi:hypothetical protein